MLSSFSANISNNLLAHSDKNDNRNKSNFEKDKDAFNMLGLEFNVEWPLVQKKFKILVKKFLIMTKHRKSNNEKEKSDSNLVNRLIQIYGLSVGHIKGYPRAHFE